MFLQPHALAALAAMLATGPEPMTLCPGPDPDHDGWNHHDGLPPLALAPLPTPSLPEAVRDFCDDHRIRYDGAWDRQGVPTWANFTAHDAASPAWQYSFSVLLEGLSVEGVRAAYEAKEAQCRAAKQKGAVR